MKNRCDILSLEWGGARDLNIVEPVLCYLEKEYKFTVVRESIWYGELKLLKYRPKALLMANSAGDPHNYQCVKLAHMLGITTIELLSEGNIPQFSTKNECLAWFWGWNNDKIPYSDLILHWNQEFKSMFESVLDSNVLDRIKVSGATGFDRYKIFGFMNKPQFLKRLNKEYSKVIGIAAWGFDALQNTSPSITGDDYYSKHILQLLQTRDVLNEIYKSIISKNTDILFVLKYHPALFSKDLTEFAGLSQFQNTIEILDEVPIDDIISACDLWLAFESTTCIEAWLLGKQVLYVDPCIFNFTRTSIYNAVNVVTSDSELQNQIDLFYNLGSVSGFNEKYSDRQKVIQNFISYDDGQNHRRASEHIVELLAKNQPKQCKLSTYAMFCILKSIMRFIVYHTPIRFLFPRRSNAALSLEKKYSSEIRHKLSEKYHIKLEEFWIKLKL